MSYQVKYTDYANKGSITVNDSTINNDTSLQFPGRNTRGYGISVAENFLHLLENFANTTQPSNAVEGQLWYDTTEGVEDLKVYDGTTWKSAGSVRKSNTAPDIANSIIGDLWVDIDNQQLYLFSGASWILVGPTYSSGLKSGVQVETILDATDVERVVLISYVDGEILSIYSTSTFTPKVSIEGFTTIKAGINLSTKDFAGNGTTNKFWGTAEKAESLIIGSNTVVASNFLRKDTSNITNFGFSIRNDLGMTVGATGQLALSVVNEVGQLYHSTPGSALDLRINKDGVRTTLIRADSTGKVGIGENNLAPEETLDVAGTAKISGNVRITSTENTINSVTGALQVAGGLNVQKDFIATGKTTLKDSLVVGVGGAEIGILSLSADSAIIPAATNVYDIGQTSLRFRNIYASTTYSNLVGNVTGNVTGNVNGTASKLLATTSFNITGDIASDSVQFDGQSGGTTKTFTTTISSDFISTKTETFSVNPSDYLLIYRQTGLETGLRKISRSTFFTEIPTVPVGAIFPFAGVVIPTGYLLCDGSEKLRSKYPDLFSVIQFTYGAPGTLSGLATFKVPDLRGRFPLGKDNMDNGDQVPDAVTPGNPLIDSGGGPAGRVTDATASTLGNASGLEQRTLNVNNLPDHTHDLVGEAGTQFFVTNNNAGIPPDAGGTAGNGPTAPGQGQYYNATGSIQSAIPVGQPVNIMNPYLTINYIIYAGRVIE